MPDLTVILRLHFVREAERFGLTPDTLRVAPVLNWGGFDNASFSVTDGARRLHVKLSDRPAHLRRFYDVSAMLTERYRCPPVLGWFDVPETECGGLVFDAVDGGPADQIPLHVMRDLGRLLERLHTDADLRARLGGGAERCVQTYLGVYERRFTADLAMIEAAPPPFVTPARLQFMHAEARGLTAQVVASDAFQETAQAPIHADIWEHNILMDRSGAWFLIDWDGLRIGDPALDWAMASGMAQVPTETGSALALPNVIATRARNDLYRRAMRLDGVIDVLADWIAAADHPQWMDEVRAANQLRHEQALDGYRALYC